MPHFLLLTFQNLYNVTNVKQIKLQITNRKIPYANILSQLHDICKYMYISNSQCMRTAMSIIEVTLAHSEYDNSKR